MRSRLSDAFNLDSPKKWWLVQQLFEQKDHMTLIKAGSNLPSRLRSASLLILAGDGELLNVRSFYEQIYLMAALCFWDGLIMFLIY